MSGFPVRTLRSEFGPTFKDARPVEKPENEQSADSTNLSLHVTTGSGLVVPQFSLVVEWDPTLGDFHVYHQAETWNVDNAFAHPVLSRLSLGNYTYKFANSYPDMNGEAVSLSLSAVRCSAMGTGSRAFAKPAPFFYISQSDPTLVCFGFYEANGSNGNDTATTGHTRLWLEGI